MDGHQSRQLFGLDVFFALALLFYPLLFLLLSFLPLFFLPHAVFSSVSEASTFFSSTHR